MKTCIKNSRCFIWFQLRIFHSLRAEVIGSRTHFYFCSSTSPELGRLLSKQTMAQVNDGSAGKNELKCHSLPYRFLLAILHSPSLSLSYVA